VRCDRAGRVRVRYWAEREPGQARSSAAAFAVRGDDFTTVVALQGLRPATRYAYRIELAASGSQRFREQPPRSAQRFRTLRRAGTPGTLRFVVGADIARHDSRGIEQIHALAPDFVLLLGDNAYVDGGGRALDDYRARYQRAWGARRMRELLAEIPSFMMWDDHEIRDNAWADRSRRRYRSGRKSYEEYQHAHNPEPLRAGDLYYRFVAGDVELFVLDVRSHRSPNDAPDGPGKSMLGPAQKRELLRFVAESPARLRVIGSPVTVSRHATTGDDAWNGFAHERRELLDAITRSAAPALVLSGDQHWNGLLRWQHRVGDRRRVLYELVATPLAAERRPSPGYESDEILARDQDHNVFGVVDVDTREAPLRVTLTLCRVGRGCRPGRERPPRSSRELPARNDSVPYTVALTGDDLRTHP
jgi:alkaline phosphatase D